MLCARLVCGSVVTEAILSREADRAFLKISDLINLTLYGCKVTLSYLCILLKSLTILKIGFFWIINILINPDGKFSTVSTAVVQIREKILTMFS